MMTTQTRLVKARLIGPPDGVEHLGALLAQLDGDQGVEIANVSTAYPSRGSTTTVRVYVELLITPSASDPETSDAELPSAPLQEDQC